MTPLDEPADALRAAQRALEARTAELGESLSLMRATLEATADGILVTASDGRVLAFNERFLVMWGITRAQVEGRRHADLALLVGHRFGDARQLAARIAEIYASPPADELDTLVFDDNLVLERFSRPQMLEGRVVGRVWSYRDVTARRRVEEAAHDEARLLDALNRTGAAISSTLDFDALLQIVTDAATQLSEAEFGAFFYNAGGVMQLYTLSGAARAAFESLGPPRATPVFAPTLEGGAVVRCDDVTQDARYGLWAPHHGMPPGHPPVRSYLGVPVVSARGPAIGGLFFGHARAGVFGERAERLVRGIAAQAAIAFDNARLYDEMRRVAADRERLVEGERAARGQIAHASRLKDEFLATLSHELRTPLTAILGWARVLLRKHDDAQLLQRALEAIERNAVAQAQIVDDLLDMSRIVSGTMRLDVRPTDLAAVVDAALESVRPSADARGVRLVRVLDPRAGPVPADPGRLQQVVWNLLTNAVKFTPRGGQVDVLLRRVDSQLELTVADTGSGIPPAFLPHVFDRFRQADSSATRTHGGLGLGLSIVKQLVEMHGGTVHAASAGEDQGATFIVRLPLSALRPEAGEQHPAAPIASPALALDLAGVRVLVVDDEPDARALLAHLLGEHGAVVQSAASADEALQAFAERPPDVLVSDIGMPGRDGYQLIRELRALPVEAGGRTPAIALTAFARSEDRTRALLAGYQLHVAKPIEPHELLAALASMAGRVPPR
jgi:PAS domain S-box-containing protein